MNPRTTKESVEILEDGLRERNAEGFQSNFSQHRGHRK